jgi:hypothetical protein
MRKWKEDELGRWIDARLQGTFLKRDQRILIARSLAKQLLESPEITIRFHSAARMKRLGARPKAKTKGKR